MPPSPTQSVPGGFLLVFFGTLSLIYSGLSAYAAWLVYHKEYIEKQPTEYSFIGLSLGALCGLLIATTLIYIGLRMAFYVGSYDTHDPKQPSVKF